MGPVPEYRLELDPSDYRWFSRHVGTERCFPARLMIGDADCQGWVGYRGRFSRWFPKPSYQLWFSEAPPGLAVQQLHLNATYYDPALLRTRLAFELFQSIGVPTPEAWHVTLTVNGVSMGLYTAIESVDEHWLRRRELPPGSIYYGVGGKGNFGLLNLRTGRLKRYLAEGYEKCHPADDDFTEIEELVRSITLSEEAEFEAGIDAWVDVPEYLHWLIGAVFISHTDGLVQNYALLRGADGRWQISPWDCDATFGRCPDGRRLSTDHLDVDGVRGNYLTARLLANRRWRQEYANQWDLLLADQLSPSAVAEKLDAIYTAIRTPALHDRMKRFGNRTFLREPGLIKRYLADRVAYLTGRLQLLKSW